MDELQQIIEPFIDAWTDKEYAPDFKGEKRIATLHFNSPQDVRVCFGLDAEDNIKDTYKFLKPLKRIMFDNGFEREETAVCVFDRSIHILYISPESNLKINITIAYEYSISEKNIDVGRIYGTMPNE